MGRNRLGPEKHKRCEEIGGRTYDSCWIRGSDPVVQCWFTDEDGDPNNSDLIDYRHRKGPWPRTRKGKFVGYEVVTRTDGFPSHIEPFAAPAAPEEFMRGRHDG